MQNIKYHVNHDIFLKENENSYYLLGVFMSDGSLDLNGRYRAEICSQDEDWLGLLRDVISPTRPILSQRKNLRKLSISGKSSVEWLYKQGCIPNKSKVLNMPEVPDKYLRDFVRGYFDGDGSISFSSYKKKKKEKMYEYQKLNCYICSGSERFIVALNDRLNESGLKTSVYESKTKPSIIRGKKVPAGTSWRVSFGDRTALAFLEWMYYKENLLTMPRKLQKAKEAFKYYKQKASKDKIVTCL